MSPLSFDELTEQMMNLYKESKYSEALQIVEQNADRFPEQSVRTTFWKMCVLSLCGRANDVISVFQQGLDSGLWWAESQFRDTDLDAVRHLPEFKRLAAISQERYEEARKQGWLVLSPQSTQPLYSGSYSWIDPEQALADLNFYAAQISKDYPINQQRVVIAGFSQGSGMAIYAALSGSVNARGFLAIGTYWADPNALRPLAKQARSVRGYFITGEQDQYLDKIKEIQNILRESNILFGEEAHPDLGHEFPGDFGSSFDKAIEFIFKENE